MDILDNRLLGIILGILLIIVIFLIKSKKIEPFSLWDNLMDKAFRLIERPIGLVMSKLGGIAGSEVNKVTSAVKEQANNAIRTGTTMANNAIRNAKSMADNAINQTKDAVTKISDKVQSTIRSVANTSMKTITETIREIVDNVQMFVMKLMERIQKFFTVTILSTLEQSKERAKEVWEYVVDTTYIKIKNFTNIIKESIMKFIKHYIKMATPYSLYIAIATGILAVGGLGSYIYFNFFHDPNAKSSNNNNTPVNNTPVNNTPVNNTPVNNTPVNNTPVTDDTLKTIPQTVE